MAVRETMMATHMGAPVPGVDTPGHGGEQPARWRPWWRRARPPVAMRCC